MNYSELIKALNEKDDVKANRILKEITPHLIKYLMYRMGAPKSDAEDCVQQAFIYALEVIREDKLKDPDKILSYLLRICRNNYLRVIRDERKMESVLQSNPTDLFEDPDQLKKLISRERMEILEKCLEELTFEYRNFITYWFRYPEADSKDIAEHFGITLENLWTRKHRIINKLNDCYRKKSNL